jgi:hypothetical protein
MDLKTTIAGLVVITAVVNPIVDLEHPVRDHVGPEMATMLMPTANSSASVTATTHVSFTSDCRFEATANPALLRDLGTIPST